MADRYLVATGDWNSTGVWSSSYSGSPGASVPGVGDNVILGSTGSTKTVTMVSDVTVASITGFDDHYAGAVNVSGYTLTITGLSNLRFMGLDLTDSTLVLKDGGQPIMGSPTISNSRIVLYAPHGQTRYLPTQYSGATLDVVYYLGDGGAGSSVVNVTGSPTFRSLIIQSKNSAAHTVNFDVDASSGSTATVDKLIAIGSSPISKLTLAGKTGGTAGYSTFQFSQYGTSFGQNINLVNLVSNTQGPTHIPAYIGSSSSADTNSTNWLLQDPPKISTLVDPLTTSPASNPNWTFPDGYPSQVSTGHYGGGYDLTGGFRMISVDTFDLVDGDYVVEQEPASGYPYIMLSIKSDGSATSSASTDGSSWEELFPPTTIDPALFRSVRLGAGDAPPLPEGVIGSVNPSLAAPSNANFLQFFGGY